MEAGQVTAANISASRPVAASAAVREVSSHWEMAVETVLQQALGFVDHENCVGNDDHLKGFQRLERAIKLLPPELASSVSQKWDALAADLLRNQAQPRFSAWSKRERIRALYREVADIFAKVRADHGGGASARA